MWQLTQVNVHRTDANPSARFACSGQALGHQPIWENLRRDFERISF